MLKMCSRMLAIIFAVTMVWAGSAMALSISFNDGNDNSTELTVLDGDTNNDLSPMDGYVMYSGTIVSGAIGHWDIATLAGTSAPAVGSIFYPVLDMFSLTVDWVPTIQGQVGGTLAVTVEDTYANFNDLNAAIKGFEASIGGTTAGSVDFYAKINGTTIDISWDEMNRIGPAFSGAESLLMADISGNATAPFTLSMTAVIIQGQGTTSFDAQIAPVPEPATMILFGIGLIGIAGVTRKKLNLKRPE